MAWHGGEGETRTAVDLILKDTVDGRAIEAGKQARERERTGVEVAIDEDVDLKFASEFDGLVQFRVGGVMSCPMGCGFQASRSHLVCTYSHPARTDLISTQSF